MNLKNKTKKEKGILALALLSFTYGLMPLLPRYLSTSFEIFQQMYLRMFVGFVLLLIFFNKNINLNKLITLPHKEKGWVFIRAFLYYFLGVGLFTYAILNTKISNVAFIGAIPTTAILGFIFLREQITVPKILMVMLSAFGVFIISVKDLTGTFSIGIGELAILFSAVFISLGLISRKRESNLLNDSEIAALMLLFAGAQFLIASIVTGEGFPVSGWSIGIILAMLFAGLLNACLSFLTNYGFARVDAVLASNIVATSVAFSTFFAFLVFKEIPTLRELFGGILIIVSALLIHRYDGSDKSLKL